MPPGLRPWGDKDPKEHFGDDWKKNYGSKPGAWNDALPEDVAKKFELLLTDQITNMADKIN